MTDLLFQEASYLVATPRKVTSWPVDPFAGLAFGESVVGGQYIVRYFSNHILRLDKLEVPVADYTATKEFFRLGFETKLMDKAMELHLGIIRLHKYQPI
jgi:hypothetical protein